MTSYTSTTPDPTPRCARGDRCRAAEQLDGHWVGGPTTRPLCDHCTADVAASLGAAPELYVRLRSAFATPGTSTGGERVTRSKARPLPINAAALELTERLHWLTTTWADEVIATAGRPAPDRAAQPEAQQVVDACRLLTTYLTAWTVHQFVTLALTIDTADPDNPRAEPTSDQQTVVQAGWEAAGELLDWDAQAHRVLGLSPLVRRLPEPCPSCAIPWSLERRDGSDDIVCRHCLHQWTQEAYDRLVHAWVGAA